MVLPIVLLLTLAGCSSAISPKQNISGTAKNGTGAAHWIPPALSSLSALSPLSPAALGGFPAMPLVSPFSPPQPGPISPLSLFLQQLYRQPIANFAPPAFGPTHSFIPPLTLETAPYALDPPNLVHPGTAQPPPPHGVTRQFCRYTATVNDYGCNYCCKIAARHYSTSVDEVSGILFKFDPDMPPVDPATPFTGASLKRKKRQLTPDTTTNASNHTGSTIPTVSPDEIPEMRSGLAPMGVNMMATGPLMIPGPPLVFPVAPIPVPAPSEPGVPRRIPQCFCCAPKKFFGWI